MFLLFVFGASLCSNAQVCPPETHQDSVSNLIYKNIRNYSQKNKLSRELYRLFFHTPDTLIVKPKPQGWYENAEGKIIRNIRIMTHSPFDVTDSVKFFSEGNLNNIANYLHLNTQKFVLHNLLMFRQNEVFDSLRVQESERLLRSQRYINRARIVAYPVAGTDSVDVIVQERDEFSLIPDGSMSSSTFTIGMRETNLFGLGHQAKVDYEWDYNGRVNNYGYEYNVPNIMGIYISADLIYHWNPEDSSEVKRLSFHRPFYSPLAHWAGGADILYQVERRGFYVPDLETRAGQSLRYVIQPLRYNVYDFWGAYALKFKNRSRNLTLSTRYYHIDYKRKPLPEYDIYHIYSRENLFLAGIGFSERTYRQDAYLFRFGYTEDVPVGQVYSITAGIQNKNNLLRPYLAVKAASGQYFKLGYWSYALEYGSFFEGKTMVQGVVKAELNYFTPVVELGEWKFRQFLKPQAVLGIRRLPVERLMLNGSTILSGTNQLALTGQSRFYMPWNLWGFRFAPYLVYTAGVYGDDNGFSPKRLYVAMDTGILFRNDHLVFNSFEFSFSFFLYTPDSNIYRFNSYSARDLGLRDFDIGKPGKVLFE
ncbi:hypothetical protein FACS189413_08540 [Bacteroidia bacterium]|nr:hypothetical protein FACS189413_08540 [Bacteroidia bacterium]